MKHTETLETVCREIFSGLSAGRGFKHDAVQAVGLKALHVSGTVLVDAIEYFVPGNRPKPVNALCVGDVLVAVRGSLAKTALVEVASPTEPLYATGNIAVLRPGPRLSPVYLWAFMSALCAEPGSPRFRRSGTGQMSMRVSDLKMLSIPLPPLAEQVQLGEAARALRELVTAQESVLEQSQRTFSAFLRDRLFDQ